MTVPSIDIAITVNSYVTTTASSANTCVRCAGLLLEGSDEAGEEVDQHFVTAKRAALEAALADGMRRLTAEGEEMRRGLNAAALAAAGVPVRELVPGMLAANGGGGAGAAGTLLSAGEEDGDAVAETGL